MIGYFKKIELGYDEATDEVIVPSFRQDILCQADLAEEVARFYGYDNIPTTLPTGSFLAEIRILVPSKHAASNSIVFTLSVILEFGCREDWRQTEFVRLTIL